MVRRILAFLWETHMPIYGRIKDDLEEEVTMLTPRMFEEEGKTMDDLIRMMGEYDLTIVYRQASEFSENIRKALYPIKDKFRIINFANDPSLWDLTSVDHDVAIKSYEYMLKGGDENFLRMFDYVAKALLGKEGEPLPPVDYPWQGLITVKDDVVLDSLDDYLDDIGYDGKKPLIGVLGSRPSYMMDRLSMERNMCQHIIKKGAVPVFAFCSFSAKPEFGCLSPADVIKRYFTDGKGNPRVDAIIKMTTTFIGEDRDPTSKEANIDTLEYVRRMNIPIFQPIVLASSNEQQWRESIGVTTELAWHVSFPEFEGIVDPYVVASNVDAEGERRRVSFDERMDRFVERVVNCSKLSKKKNSDKKIVIFLNNFPCNGVEANVGNAAGLDTLESISDLMKEMKRHGYSVDPPKDGKDLINRILEHKALSEFRWTSAEAIGHSGGSVYSMGCDEYNRFFEGLSIKAQEDVKATWGEPPGKAMVLDGRILITGVSFGNVIVAVQPKRGCYGARCDGEVCKILHDPACPPTHQYLATYHYYEHIWGADAVIHTGTHGSMEWTPGKGVGLTESCYPDICMWSTPHFYIYNSDNPSEGLVAKRRSYAVLIDHMQHLMKEVNLYGGYLELDKLLKEFVTARNDPVRSEELKKRILESVKEVKMDRLDLDESMDLYTIVQRCHEELSMMRNSLVNKGLHILGRMPEGDDLTSAVTSIVRYGEEHNSLRDCIAELLGLDLSYLYKHKGEIDESREQSNEELLRCVEDRTREFVGHILDDKGIEESLVAMGLSADDRQKRSFEPFVEIIKDIAYRIESSDEIGAMMNALNGGFVPPGPSGYITRGEYRIIPTGRNFYAMDPYAVPSRSAYSAGCRIAETEIKRYLDDTGEYPESLGFFWTMGELISSGGEQMSQIMYLLGAEPEWGDDGRVHGFKIIPLGELGRPRIDISINVSCILRDNMMNAIDYIDSIVSVVSDLDEPSEKNYVRKHSIESIIEGMDGTDAKARLFGAPPGTYTSGVNLAVFASAWKEDKDLADVFVRTKGHGYGGGRNGRPMYQQFAKTLSRTNAVLESKMSDENDLLSCSCHFSNIGGMVSACRYLSDSDVKAYCVDTRDPRDISVGTLKEEIERAMRNRTFNPEWLKDMKAHGYKGANDIAKRVVRMFGWQATTHEVDDWLFDQVVEVFVKDKEMQEFFKENNVYALEELERRLLEAEARGIWNTDEDTLNELKDAYLEIEGILEGYEGEGETQGGSIDIFDKKSIQSWSDNDRGVSAITESIHARNSKE